MEAVNVGEKAASEKIADLRRDSVSEADYARFASAHRLQEFDPPLIQFLEVLRNRSRTADYVEQNLAGLTGKPLDVEELEKKIGARVRRRQLRTNHLRSGKTRWRGRSGRAAGRQRLGTEFSALRFAVVGQLRRAQQLSADHRSEFHRTQRLWRREPQPCAVRASDGTLQRVFTAVRKSRSVLHCTVSAIQGVQLSDQFRRERGFRRVPPQPCARRAGNGLDADDELATFRQHRVRPRCCATTHRLARFSGCLVGFRRRRAARGLRQSR